MSTGNLRSRFTTNISTSVVDPDELRRNVADAPTYRLLLSAIHVTGDPTLLDRFADRVDPGRFVIAREKFESRETPEARAEIIEILAEALSREEQPDYLGVDDRELFQRMSDFATGMSVPGSQREMNLEQSGFVADERSITPTKTPPPTIDVAIIGAGMTGIDAAVKATDRGFSYQIFDLESGIGGLWWSQTYPGVAVDTPSMQYSLSWAITPDWSMAYPLGREYRAYLHQIAETYDLASHFNPNSEVTRMEWLDDEQQWELTVFSTTEHTSRRVRAAAVITAAGHLNRPKYPDIEGIDSFAGESVHTGKWRDVDLAGKRVGVVGVGAAGVQVITTVAPVVGHLTAFQRQAHWIMPNLTGEERVEDSERWLRRHLPYYQQWSRMVGLTQGNYFAHSMNVVDEGWMKEHPQSISAINEGIRQMCLSYIGRTFGEGSELANQLTPDFPFGGKRPVRDPGIPGRSGYYWAFQQPHVDLVSSGLARVVPEGIVTADGTLTELDVVVWATGMTLDFLSTIEIVGLDGVHLSDVWADNNPRTYLGGTVPGFPNLFVNDGPNTGVANGGGGHNFMSETVNHYAFEALQLMVENDATSIEVTQEAHDAHNDTLEDEMSRLIWTYDHKADTYYRNQAGRIILPSPFLPEDYWNMSRTPDASKFVIRALAPAETG